MGMFTKGLFIAFKNLHLGAETLWEGERRCSINILVWQRTINEHFMAHRLGDPIFLFRGASLRELRRVKSEKSHRPEAGKHTWF